MERSNLQYKDPKIEKIDFEINNDDEYNPDLPVSIEVNSDIDQESNTSTTKLKLTVGECNENHKVLTAFYFCGIISANFHWNENVKNPERMLQINGGSMLLSYIRPILSSITMQAGLKPLNLPFIDFTKGL